MSKPELDEQPNQYKSPYDQALADEDAEIDGGDRPGILDDIDYERLHPLRKPDPELLKDVFRREKGQS